MGITSGRPTLAERYVHAATRRLPEDQRADVGDELRGSIADRVASLRDEHPGLSEEKAEYAALEELGDPDRLAAGYAGKSLQLIGPELFPAYVRVLKGVLAVLPLVVIVISIIEAIEGESVGAVIGKAAWMACSIAIHIAFWVTLTFALVERSSSPDKLQESLDVEWTPDKLPDLPRGPRGSVELVSSLVWLAIIGAAIIWQQFGSPIGDNLPMLDPDLWSFWLPLILVLLVVEMFFELVKYRAGSWSPPLAWVNVALGAVFTAPIVYLAATDKLLNPAAVAEIQDGWSGFDPGTANTVVIVAALIIWVTDSVDGWRKSLSE